MAVKNKKTTASKASNKGISLELNLGSDWLGRADKVLGGLEQIKKSLTMPDKKAVEDAIDLMADFKKRVLDFPKVAEVLGAVEGRKSSIQLDFDKLTLDGSISINLTPVSRKPK